MSDGEGTAAVGGAESNPHRAVILEDVRNRADWAKIDAEILKRRRGKRRKKKTKPYPGAPNSLVPIVDDTTREKTDQEITMTCNAPVFAHIIPLHPEVAGTARSMAEMGFDAFLRHILIIRPKLEEAMDTKNARGMGLFLVNRSEHPRFGVIPDVEVVDPRDLIVPYYTKNILHADRFTRVLRLSPAQLRKRGVEKNWQNVEEIIEAAEKDEREGGTDEEDTLEATASLVGLTTSGENSGTIVIWEYWHEATEWDVEQDDTGLIEEGKRCVTVFSPDAPELIARLFPWCEWETRPMNAKEMEAEIEAAGKEERVPDLGKEVAACGAERQWPVVQARYENRSSWYYDTRGIGHLCMDDQIAATAQQNAKLVMMDYHQQPLLEGSFNRNVTNVTFEPGSFLPEGASFANPPQISPQFDFDVEKFKRSAARRAGAASQYEFSGEMSRTRKVQKTATEVNEESARAGLVSSASVDRFNDPLRELYQQIWEDLKRLRKPLPLIVKGQLAQFADPETIYSFDVMIVPAASAKTLNPDLQFLKAKEVFMFLAQFKEFVPLKIYEGLLDISSHWDPVQATRWIGDPNEKGPQGQPPIYQMAQNMQKQVEGVVNALKQIHEQAGKSDKTLERVARLANRTADQLEKMKERPAVRRPR